MIRLSLRLREELERALQLGLEDEPKLAGVLAGMVFGERSDIPPDTYADFQHTGVFHVFAINGLHVGLVTGLVLIVLRLMRIPRRWCGHTGGVNAMFGDYHVEFLTLQRIIEQDNLACDVGNPWLLLN